MIEKHIVEPQITSKCTKIVLGDMVYNPVLHLWEGNESALTEFDKPATTPSNKLSLIQNTTGGKQPERVGNMIFDPDKMCWVGNEEDADVFAGIDMEISVNEKGIVVLFIIIFLKKKNIIDPKCVNSCCSILLYAH